MTKTNLLLVMLLSLVLGAGALGISLGISRALAKPEQGRQKLVGDEVGMTEAPLMAKVDKSELERIQSEKQARTEAVTGFLKTLHDRVGEFGIQSKSLPGLDNANLTTVQPSQLVNSLKQAIEEKVKLSVSGEVSGVTVVPDKELVTRTSPKANESFFIDGQSGEPKIWFAPVSVPGGSLWISTTERVKDPNPGGKEAVIKNPSTNQLALGLDLICRRPTAIEWKAALVTSLTPAGSEIKDLDRGMGEYLDDRRVIGISDQAQDPKWNEPYDEEERKKETLKAGEVNPNSEETNRELAAIYQKRGYRKGVAIPKENTNSALAEIAKRRGTKETFVYRWVVVPPLKEASSSRQK